MKKKPFKNINYAGLALTILLLLLYLGCEGFEEETFEFSELELSSVELMQDTLVIDIILPIINDYDTSWTAGPAILAAASEVIDSLAANSFLVIPQDSCYRLTLDETVDTSYLALNTGIAGPLALFFNQTILIDLFDESGAIVAPDDSNLEMSVIATGIGYEYDAADARLLKYYLKTSRYYSLDNARYLIRMIETDQTNSAIVRQVIKAGS